MSEQSKDLIPGGLLYEGHSAALPPRPAPVAARCGSNPFGPQVRDEIVETISTWISISAVNRTTFGAVHQLRAVLLAHPKKHIFETVKANFYGSARDEAKEALRLVGLLK